MARPVSHHSSAPVRQAARSYIAELRAQRLKRASGSVAEDRTAKPQDQPPHASTEIRTQSSKTSSKVGKCGVKSSGSSMDESTETSASIAEQDALRQSVLAELHDISGKPHTHEPPLRKAKAKSAEQKKQKPTPKPASQKKPPSSAGSLDETNAPPKASDAPQKTGPNTSFQARQNARAAIRTGAQQARATAHEAQQKIRAARLMQRAAAAKQREHLQAAKAKRSAQKTSQETNKTATGSAASEPPRRRWIPQRSAAACSQTIASKAPPKTSKQSAAPRVGSARIARPATALTALHGIGDAMNRRLEQAGICTLDDLVALPPETIRGRLGPVSALANVEGWQAEAAKELPK